MPSDTSNYQPYKTIYEETALEALAEKLLEENPDLEDYLYTVLYDQVEDLLANLENKSTFLPLLTFDGLKQVIKLVFQEQEDGEG